MLSGDSTEIALIKKKMVGKTRYYGLNCVPLKDTLAGPNTHHLRI